MPEKPTAEEAQRRIDSGAVVAIHFTAQWCEPCKDLDAALDQLQGSFPAVHFLSVDCEVHPALTEKYKVESVPHLLVFRNGSAKGSVSGAKIPQIVELLQTVTGYLHDSSIPLEDRLKTLINRSEVMLFIKGTPSVPRCGFTAQILELINATGVKYDHFDVLSNEEVRQNLKKVSNWPTFPQVFVKGQLIGGLDVCRELKENGELEQSLGLTKKTPGEGPLTADDVQRRIDSGAVVALHFTAEWCEPCKDLDAALDQIRGSFPTVQFLSIDAEKLSTLTEKYHVESVPHVLVFRDGNVKGAVSGAKINEVRKLLETVTGYLHDSSIPLDERLRRLINSSEVMVFMKGTPEEPRCGFTGQMVDLLKEVGAKYSSFDIGTNEEVRQGLKTYSNWPTYPQVYFKGQLIGGLDVCRELKENGELEQALGLPGKK